MPVALWHSVTALLRENRHELLEGQKWCAHLPNDLHFVALNKISGEWSIVEWIVPRPALASMVVIAVDPLQALDVGLPDSDLESLLVFLSVNVELIVVVSEFVAFFTQLNLVLVLCHNSIIFGITHFLHLLFHSIFDNRFSCFITAAGFKRGFELFLCSLELLFLGLRFGKTKLGLTLMIPTRLV